MDFKFTLTSSSVWRTELTGELKGKLRYGLGGDTSEQGEIRQNPELRLSDQVKGLERTFDGVFTVRQYLPTEVNTDLGRWSGKDVDFIFDDITLQLKLHSPF